jgi:hypothetical protein
MARVRNDWSILVKEPLGKRPPERWKRDEKIL